jgi:hypothetical protein
MAGRLALNSIPEVLPQPIFLCFHCLRSHAFSKTFQSLPIKSSPVRIYLAVNNLNWVKSLD